MFGLDVEGVDSVRIGQADMKANFSFNSESKVMRAALHKYYMESKASITSFENERKGVGSTFPPNHYANCDGEFYQRNVAL